MIWKHLISSIFYLKVLAFIAGASCDAYTIGQVAHGHTYGGVVTGVDYGHGLVSGVGAIGNRAVYAHAPAVHSYAAVPALHHGAYYGKREAEADAEAYTPYQVAAGLPVHNAYATGHPHNVGVVTGVSHGVYAHAYAPAVHSYAAVPAVHHGVYYGKREADADAYTPYQVAYGLPVHNAYATGHAHNVGVVTGVSYPLSYAHHVGYTGYAAPFYG